jgi:hypothetical protein
MCVPISGRHALLAAYSQENRCLLISGLTEFERLGHVPLLLDLGWR